MHISYKDVEQQCNSLHELAKSMDETITQINTLNASVKGVWLGPAADAFTENLGAAAASFAEVRVAIETSILYMAKCAEGYKAIDKTVMQEICDYLNIDNPTKKGSGGSPNADGGSNKNEDIAILTTGSGVIVTDGQYKGQYGIVNSIDKSNKKYKLLIQNNGSESLVDVGFDNVSTKVTINEGTYKNMSGTISNIDSKNNKITIDLNLNGQKSSVEIDMNSIAN